MHHQRPSCSMGAGSFMLNGPMFKLCTAVFVGTVQHAASN
jgi:hypothetical protein